MGCVTSKQAVSVTPALDHSGAFRDNAAAGGSGRSRGSGVVDLEKKKKKRTDSGVSENELGESGRVSSNGGGGESLSFRLGNLQKYVEGEQVAAGWPAWLSAVAGEAIHGWVGQGTYSSVFRARNLETGRIVALKKVRFDNFEPESVRFMAREIMILRRLDHPNIIKLEGLITSRLSCSIYLVFEYMEHDISGLLSSPDIKFSEAQVKCYMKQLLSGLEHCHSRGTMHRDIKGANLLVNNEGVLKMADFGLANFCASVDLWSVGCVFAELLLGSPILQGRTEVEQLHKIFKLCGSPPDDYWRKSKLPHATLFKPQHPYESSLGETFKDLPKTAVNLIETLLSVEPYKRGTASSALASEYFKTKPYACDPLTLPKYPPNKEIDAKHREEAQRKKPGGRVRGPETRAKLTRKPNGINKLAPAESLPAQTHSAQKINSHKVTIRKEGDIILAMEPPKPSIEVTEEASHVKHASQGDVPFPGPLQVSGSSGFAWAKRRIDESSMRSRSRSSSRSLILEPSGPLHAKNDSESNRHENVEVVLGSRTSSRGEDSYEIVKHAMLKNWSQLERPDSFDASDGYHSQELSLALYQREEMATKRMSLVYQDQGDKVEFSGPLLSQSHRVDELLERHERHIRQAVRRSWFQRGKKL
ncbi:hypothetical protein TEA_010387 [Camellia sinensis var. sinensis]|uniref:Protein kinase domain-containing protein n=1 Tax=Camellia sinensis var. sinensis TaxID=542762 RepID=A0A4S4DVZ4_CAMSN|nr:hypothetical protein TEA_010387 [Camellia sinensis var. sinensis]